MTHFVPPFMSRQYLWHAAGNVKCLFSGVANAMTYFIPLFPVSYTSQTLIFDYAAFSDIDLRAS